MASDTKEAGRFGLATKATNDNPDMIDQGLQPRQWAFSKLEGARWNKAFPYQLVLMTRDDNGNWIQDDATMGAFTLPIPPEALQISTPFSITTTATLNGIVEEHNGIVFKNLVIRGTTGILPLKSNSSPTTFNLNPQAIGGIFAGSITAIDNTTQSILKSQEYPNVITSATMNDPTFIKGTGYYQFQLLQRWLEAYSQLKMTSAGAQFAMGFAIFKEKATYIGTPISFDLTRNASSPLEYVYSLNIRSWRRVENNSTLGDAFDHPPVAASSLSLSKCLNQISAARGILEGAKDTLTAFRGDVQNTVLGPIRESILFLKSAVGAAETLADLPVNILNDMREPLLEAQSLENIAKETGFKFDQLSVSIKKSLDSLAVEAGKLEFGSGRPNDKQGTGSNQQGLGSDPTKSPHPGNKDGALEHFNFLNSINPQTITLRSKTRAAIKKEKDRVAGKKREDFEADRDSIQTFLDNFQASLGLLPATVSNTYGLPPQAQLRTPTDSDFDLIYALSATVQQFDHLVASSTINRNQVNTMDYFAGLATRSGIAFTVPTGKLLVPMPYDTTLEQLSAQYFGTPDRWHEIAALNGLQSPYIDEVGFILPILTNGQGNTVLVSDASNLYVNQAVWFQSTVANRIKRHVTHIEKLNDGQFLIRVDGDQDLGVFTTTAAAYLQAFLPNTVNSQQSLYIPSDETVDENDFKQKAIPGVDQFDPLVRIGGIDLLLNSKNDLIFTPDGDCRLSVGLTNIIQKIRILVGTPRGTLLDHPEYGFPIQPGQSQADLTADEILGICQQMFKDDPTFSGVESVSVTKDGPVVLVSLYVALRGVGKSIPVTINVVR